MGFVKSLTSRTTLITSVAVAGVLIAGTAAVAANIGILNASNDSVIGSLSATEDLVPSTTLDIAVPTSTPASIPGRTETAEASYVVDDAGTVSVSTTSDELTLVDAAGKPGWTPTATQPDPLSLRITFDNGTRTLVFTARLGDDGAIVAEVTEPVIVAGAAPTTVEQAHSDDADHADDVDSNDDDVDSNDDDVDSNDDDRDEIGNDSPDYEGADDDD